MPGTRSVRHSNALRDCAALSGHFAVFEIEIAAENGARKIRIRSQNTWTAFRGPLKIKWMATPYPAVEESLQRLHAAGWSVGDVRTTLGWLVTGTNGENVIKVRADAVRRLSPSPHSRTRGTRRTAAEVRSAPRGAGVATTGFYRRTDAQSVPDPRTRNPFPTCPKRLPVSYRVAISASQKTLYLQGVFDSASDCS